MANSEGSGLLLGAVLLGGAYLMGGGTTTSPDTTRKTEVAEVVARSPVSQRVIVQTTPNTEHVEPANDKADDGGNIIIADLRSYTYQQAADTSLCTQDCSGHDAGFQWAIDNDITDPDQCGGKSISFEEGCRAFGEEVVQRATGEADDGSEEDENGERGRATSPSEAW